MARAERKQDGSSSNEPVSVAPVEPETEQKQDETQAVSY